MDLQALIKTNNRSMKEFAEKRLQDLPETTPKISLKYEPFRRLMSADNTWAEGKFPEQGTLIIATYFHAMDEKELKETIQTQSSKLSKKKNSEEILSKSLQAVYRDFPELPPVVDRYSSDSWIYDGESFALRRCPGRNYSAFEILHEICHWFIAHEDQRELPEFGLIPGLVDPQAWGPKGGPYRDSRGHLNWEACKDAEDGYLPLEEQNAQEIVVQKLSILLGQKYQVPLKIPDLPQITTWEQYQEFKASTDWEDTPRVLSIANQLEEKVFSTFL